MFRPVLSHFIILTFLNFNGFFERIVTYINIDVCDKESQISSASFGESFQKLTT
jgi:hypothetical protein